MEMQLNEHKLTNADMIAQSLGLCARVTSGSATTQEYMAAVRTAVLPVVETYRAALDRALLTEAEKRQGLFFVPDTTELLKGDMTSRFGAYATALQNNIMSIDEVRYRENLPPLGFNFMRLGLADVLYDPASGRIITPNTGLTQDTQAGLTQDSTHDIIVEERKKDNWVKGAKGYFAGSVPMYGGRMTLKEIVRVSHQIATDYPLLPAGETMYPYENRNHFYLFSVVEFGQYDFKFKIKIDGNEDYIRDIRKELHNGDK